MVTRLRLLRQPQIFSGTCSQNVVDWVGEFNLIFDASGVSEVEKAKYLPLYLEGTPLLWYKSTSTEDRKSMVTLGDAMMEKFAPRNSADSNVRNLWLRTLLPGERMIDYVYSKLSLCRIVEDKMAVDLQISWVKRGLPNHYLERLRYAACPTVEKLITELLELETFGPETHPIGAIGANTGTLKSLISEVLDERDARRKREHMEELDSPVESRLFRQARKEKEHMGELDSRVESRSHRQSEGEKLNDFDTRFRDRSRPKFNGTCWRCGIMGHTRAQCHVNLRSLKDDGTCMRSDSGSRGLSRNPRQ